jgi:hypothetical protein
MMKEIDIYTATKNSGNGREEGGSPDMFPTVILAEVVCPHTSNLFDFLANL